MSTRVLEVSFLSYIGGVHKSYIVSDNASETFKGICPGDVLKVIDTDSGDTLVTGIMCTSPRNVPCGDCIFNVAVKPFIVGACDHVPCHGMKMIPRKPEDVLAEL